MNIGYFNAQGINDIEHWFKLEIDELRRRNVNIRVYSLRNSHPTGSDIRWMDFAHYHYSHVANYFKRSGVPFCISPHTNDVFPDNGRTLLNASKHPNCKFVTYQSFYHKKFFEEIGIDKPLVYLPMCVRTELFKRSKPFHGSSPCGILAGGRLIPRKGLDRIIHLNNLTIFGDGPLKSQLQSRNSNVKFVGHKSGEDLRDLYEENSIYLFPARIVEDGNRDGIPNTVKEAMLMELQVIASPITGIKELENVMFLKDWSKIEDVINDISKEPNWKGRQEILKTYSPDVCVNMLLKAIEEYGQIKQR